MDKQSQTLTLLSGTAVQFGVTQSVVLPEVNDVQEGDTVLLENENREFIAYAKVIAAEVETFALLQQKHFSNSAHPQMTAWHTAHEAMQSLVPGFSQTDKVTVVWFAPFAVTDTGVTVQVKDSDGEVHEETEMTEEEFDALVVTLNGENEQ